MAARRPLRRVRRTAASPPETRTSRYRDDSAISGIGRDYERLAGINFPRGFLVYLFCQLDGVVGGFMCKKTTPLNSEHPFSQSSGNAKGRQTLQNISYHQ